MYCPFATVLFICANCASASDSSLERADESAFPLISLTAVVNVPYKLSILEFAVVNRPSS